VPAQPAGPELCDGLDNDCDGVPDDGFNLDVPCSSMGKCPQARACSTDGKSSGCVDDPRLFSDENCDGIDNDCDGLVDRVAEGGVLRSVCECQDRPLPIGKVVDASIPNNQNLCAPTVCTGDKPRGLLVDGHCYPACLRTDSDSDGDGWGWENGATCLVETSMRGMAAPPCDSLPLGLAMTYCLNCNVTDALPYAMCQSVPQFDLRAFGRGELWLKVDYTYNAAGPAQAPINLWFTTSIGRKHLPLVRMGDLPGHYEVLLRADDACFTPSTAFGSACTGIARDAVRCGHCGSDEVCGALTQCGGYDLSQAWLQVAAEFCARNSGQHKGTVTVHHADLVEQNCQP